MYDKNSLSDLLTMNKSPEIQCIPCAINFDLQFNDRQILKIPRTVFR